MKDIRDMAIIKRACDLLKLPRTDENIIKINGLLEYFENANNTNREAEKRYELIEVNPYYGEVPSVIFRYSNSAHGENIFYNVSVEDVVSLVLAR